MPTRSGPRQLLALAAFVLALTLAGAAAAQDARRFATPEEAVKALAEVLKSGDMERLFAIFGPEGRDIASSSDPATGRRNQEVFLVAFGEGWSLNDLADGGKELVVGNEKWPFPVPLVKDSGGWRFDTTAGKEEILARRIGRNELAVVGICETYVLAQKAYAAVGHDGKPAGLYARRFQSDPGTQNGLHWPAKRGERRSPLGDLVAQAAAEGRTMGGQKPSPFHGYYFRILEAQGPAAPGGALDYVVGGEMKAGFALVAWPAQYDATGVMTFIVNQDGVVYEKDLGPETAEVVQTIQRYDPDSTWRQAAVETVTRE